jgi:hypothetical protein
MFRYFKTKKEVKRAELEKKRRDTKLKVEQAVIASWNNEWKKQEEVREAANLSETYKMIRYWIRLDGTVEKYAMNYANRAIRCQRILFLDEEITTHTEETQKYIDEETSKKPKSCPVTRQRSFWPYQRNMDVLFTPEPLNISRPRPIRHSYPRLDVEIVAPRETSSWLARKATPVAGGSIYPSTAVVARRAASLYPSPEFYPSTMFYSAKSVIPGTVAKSTPPVVNLDG